MVKTLLKTLFFSYLIFNGLVFAMNKSLAADFKTQEFTFLKKGQSYVTPLLLEKQAFNSVGIKVEGEIEGLMVDFGKGWEEVVIHDDYGLGNEAIVLTQPTKKVQFKADKASASAKVKTSIFYYFEDGIGGPPQLPSPEAVKEESHFYSRAEWGANESWRFKNNSLLSASIGDAEGPQEALGGCKEVDEKYGAEYNIISTEPLSKEGQTLIWPVQKTEAIEKFAVHHTDSTIKDVTGDGIIDESDYKAIVRAIYSYHTKTRGWGDIGYNYLIDPLGNIYEGRYGGETAIGAHTLCYNPETMGIAFIGNYESKPISEPAFKAASELIAEKSKKYNVDLMATTNYRGKNVEAIFGHKDVRATSCPGTMLYHQLSELKQAAFKVSKGLAYEAPISIADFNAQLLEPLENVNLKPDETKEITLKFKNSGKKTWDQSTWLHVKDNETDFRGKVIPLVEGKPFVAAQLEENQVKPGEMGTFVIKLEGGEDTGGRNFQLTPVLNGKYKIKKVETTLSLNSPASSYLARSKQLQNLDQMKLGETKYVEIELENLGKTTWKAETVKHNIYGEGLIIDQSSIPSDLVEPGEKTVVRYKISAPLEEGYFNVSLRSYYLNNGQWNEMRGAMSNFLIEVTGEGASESIALPNLPQLNQTKVELSSAIEKPLPKIPSQKEEGDFRVRLSHEANSAILTADNNFLVVNEKGDVLFDLPAQSQVQVSNQAGVVEAKTNLGIKSGTAIRLEPKNGGILEIVSMQRRPAWNNDLNDNKFRGVLEMQILNDKLAYINELPLEDYLKGIAEVSNDAPAEKQKVMAILARTYAQYYMGDTHRKFPGMPYDGNDDPAAFQRYLGYGVETRSPNFTRAVSETEGKVVTYEGKLVKTPYFNQSDGRTRSAEEVWGWKDTPYLKSVPDPASKGQKLNGHGVGLSGLGATKAAEAGKTFEEIIKYYYSGVEIEKIQ